MKIPLDYYRVFLSVAHAGSFSAASKELFISQSAVSQTIRQLETALGVTLFNRKSKQIQLTHEGDKLLEHIEPALNLIWHGENYLQSTQNLTSGQLHIGASDTLCRYYLLDYFKTFHQKYPGVEIKVTNKTSIMCVDLLANNEVDLIVTNLPNAAINDDMTITPTLSFKDVFVLSPSFDMPDHYEDLSDLEAVPILSLTKSTTTWAYLNDLFAQAQMKLTPAVELGSIDLLMDMAQIGLGVAFVPDFCLKQRPGLSRLPLKSDYPERQLGIVTSSKRSLSPAAKAFIDLVTEDTPKL